MKMESLQSWVSEHKLTSIACNMKIEFLQSWVSEHKLTSIGMLWASAVGASLFFSRARSPLKPSLRLIHARMHAQALTLGVLSGAALMHYCENEHPVEEGENAPKLQFFE